MSVDNTWDLSAIPKFEAAELNPVSSFPVLVTGGTGFLGGHVIQQLLLKGYKVRAIVRDIRMTSAYEHLNKMVNSADNLEIVEADILIPESLDRAVRGGVEYVFHLACVNSLAVSESVSSSSTPMVVVAPSYEVMYETAVTGTLNILHACAKTTSVKRVIITSCYTALSDEFENERVYNEMDWNTLSSPVRNPSCYVKVCAERAAWEFMSKAFGNQGGGSGSTLIKRVASNYGTTSFTTSSESSAAAPSFVDDDKYLYGIVNKDMKMISILPGILLGPHLGGRVNHGHKFFLLYMQNQVRGVLNVSLPIADVRDVAQCAILCMESYRACEGTSSGKGVIGGGASRYCLCNKSVHMFNVLQTIHENFEGISLPSRKLPDAIVRFACSNAPPKHGDRQWCYYNIGRVPSISCMKAKGLGMTLRPPVQTIVDSVRYLMESDNVDFHGSKSTYASSLCTIS